MHRSIGPVDCSQPRVGSLQSVDRAVDRAPPAVDRAGRPLRCACQHAHRSTGPVDRATASTTVDRAGRPCACAAADFWFSSSSLRRLPRRLPPPTERPYAFHLWGHCQYNLSPRTVLQAPNFACYFKIKLKLCFPQYAIYMCVVNYAYVEHKSNLQESLMPMFPCNQKQKPTSFWLEVKIFHT